MIRHEEFFETVCLPYLLGCFRPTEVRYPPEVREPLRVLQVWKRENWGHNYKGGGRLRRWLRLQKVHKALFDWCNSHTTSLGVDYAVTLLEYHVHGTFGEMGKARIVDHFHEYAKILYPRNY
jgi:hypothetical protein